MSDLFADPDIFKRRRANEQQVVPTFHAKSLRDWGKYESADLPNLDQLLDRTLNAIEQSHNYRERSSRTFDALWKKVCKGLREKKNAASFEHWKNASLIKNAENYRDLEKKMSALWANRLSPDRQVDPSLRLADANAYEDAKRAHATLKPKVRVTTDDILEVAIAYWIEAKNARDSRDDLRCLHALIECWTNIGATRSTKTESEAKSDAGAKQGKQLRDAIADIVTNEINALEVTPKMADPTYLLATVVLRIQSNPVHSQTLEAYEAQATAGKKFKDSSDDRIVERLKRWATNQNSSYPHLVAAYERALRQANNGKPRRSKK